MELVLSRREQDSPAGLAGADFADCYSRELPGLIWFVMSLGASAEMAADVAQSAFADAFPVWPAIQYPRAWLRRVAQRGYWIAGHTGNASAKADWATSAAISALAPRLMTNQIRLGSSRE